jgi:hypothetical protein
MRELSSKSGNEFQMIEATCMLGLIDLQKAGDEKPQMFLLTARFPNMGQSYGKATVSGTEDFLRRLLGERGIEGPTIDEMFKRALT